MQSTAQRLLFVIAFLVGLMLWAFVAFPVSMRVRDGHDWTAIVLVSLPPALAAVYLFVSGWRLGRRGVERLVVGVLFLLALVWLIGGVRQDEAAHAARVRCLHNLRIVAMSLQMYAEDHDGRLPEADVWVDALALYVAGPEELQCPLDRTQARCSYGLNSALSGVEIGAVRDPESVVLVYETARPGDNPAGGPEDVVDRHKGGAGDYFAFADGHLGWVERKHLPDGTWAKEPEAEVIWELPPDVPGTVRAIWPRSEIDSSPKSFIRLTDGRAFARRFRAPETGALLQGAFYVRQIGTSSERVDNESRQVVLSVCRDLEGTLGDIAATTLCATTATAPQRGRDRTVRRVPFSLECRMTRGVWYWLVLEAEWEEPPPVSEFSQKVDLLSCDVGPADGLMRAFFAAEFGRGRLGDRRGVTFLADLELLGEPRGEGDVRGIPGTPY
jgi:hypothetical protein